MAQHVDADLSLSGNNDDLDALCTTTLEYVEKALENQKQMLKEKMHVSEGVLRLMGSHHEHRSKELGSNISENQAPPELDDMEGVQYTGAKSEESESLDTEEEETPEEKESMEDEQDSSHDRGSKENYDDNSNKDAPETPKSEDNSLICKKQKQDKIINMQRAQIAELQPTLLKVAEEERKAEFVQDLSDKIAEEKQSIEQQEQSCSELGDIVQEIRTQLGHALWHIRKKRSGELPQEDVDYIRQYCAKSKEDVDWWLEEYGAKEPADFDSDGESDGEDDREDDREDNEENGEDGEDGEDGENGEDDVGVQDGDMLVPVQSFGLMGTITLPFVGGKRGRDVDTDEEEPSAKRGRLVEDDGGVQDGAMLVPVQSFGLMGTITLPFVGGKRGRDVDADEEEPAAKREKFFEEEL